MPNVATLVGETAAAMAMGPGCSEADEATVKSLFNAVGVIHKVRETSAFPSNSWTSEHASLEAVAASSMGCRKQCPRPTRTVQWRLGSHGSCAHDHGALRVC